MLYRAAIFPILEIDRVPAGVASLRQTRMKGSFMKSASKSQWAGRVLTAVAALPFLFSGLMKFGGSAQVAQGFEHFGWPASMITIIAVLELGSVLLYLISPSSMLGAVLLTGFLGGAMATHLRIGEPVYLHIAIGFAIWGGLFLREARLRVLLPVRGKDCVFSREIVIDRPVSEVFAYLRSLKNFHGWNPFGKADPQVRVEFKGADGAVGSEMWWDGNNSVGSGEQEFYRIVENERVDFELRFKRPFANTTTGSFATASLEAGKTKVTWTMVGKSIFPMTIFSLFMNPDKMIGGHFENGLRELKAILEGHRKSGIG